MFTLRRLYAYFYSCWLKIKVPPLWLSFFSGDLALLQAVFLYILKFPICPFVCQSFHQYMVVAFMGKFGQTFRLSRWCTEFNHFKMFTRTRTSGFQSFIPPCLCIIWFISWRFAQMYGTVRQCVKKKSHCRRTSNHWIYTKSDK